MTQINHLIIIIFLIALSSFQFSYSYDDCDVLEYRDPIITHGFEFSEIDTVWVSTYVRGSEFKKLITKEFLLTDKFIRDTIRKERYINLSRLKSLPKSNQDWRIKIGDTLIYDITEIKTDNVQHRVMVGYVNMCEIVSYKFNGKEKGRGNIFIQKSRFIYPWMKK
jgi:hypothetical protein